MKKFSDLIKKSEKISGCVECSAYYLITTGPFVNDNRCDIPVSKGIYFGFEFDRDKAEAGSLVFTRLVYVGKASADNTLRKRIGDHYTQQDLIYRDSNEKVDMNTIAFFCCEMDDDALIGDIEAAQIFKQRPPANSDGVDHYIGKTAPLLVSISNGFKFVDNDLYKNPVIIRSGDKEY